MNTRFRLGLSHLEDHKFKYSFHDSLSPIYNCGIEVETATHYLPTRNLKLFEAISKLSFLIFWNNANNFLTLDNTSLDDVSNTTVLNTIINYIASTKRFENSIFTF